MADLVSYVAGWCVSALPRRWLQYALMHQWCRTLSRGERLLLEHFGATGNAEHHDFAWADDLASARVHDEEPAD